MTAPAPSRRGFLGGTAALALAPAAAGALTAHPAAAAPAPSATAPAPAGTPRAFVHPGLLHSAADLARMRDAVAARTSPVHDGYLALAAHPRSSASYTVQNTGRITTWGRGPGDFQNQAVADSAAAYQNALLWAVTGERAHADKARDILNAWSASLTLVTGADGPLGAGLQGFKLANAAELLRHTGYDGWAAADLARCERSFLDVWYPALSGHMLYANGNWDLTALQTIAAFGVFCDQPVLFEDALRYAAAGPGNGSLRHRIVTDAGQGQESGRDQGHEQLAVGLTGDLAQVAWNQGVDLWGADGDRLLANFEYAARYNLGDDVLFVPGLDRTGKYLKQAVSATARGTLPPIYEMAYAHYTGVRGLAAPHTEAAVLRGPGATRVVEGSNDDLPGWGTLAYAGATAPAPAAPTAPAGITATGESGRIAVAWLPAAGADTYTVHRATRPQGPYRRVATGLRVPAHTDRAPRAGLTHHYTVTATNSLGNSPPSPVATATAGLPGRWASQDVGPARLPGSARFDGERFVLEASGTADTHRLVHLPLSGDGTVTARIVWPLSSQYSRIGVTVRASLAPDAPHAAMVIQGLPLHTWSGVWSVRPHAGAAVTGTGSTPVPPTQRRAVTVDAAFPISDLGTLPVSATPLTAPHVEGAGDGYRLRTPYWVRLTRRGRRCTGAISPDGVHWIRVGSTDVESGRTVHAGLLLTSCLGVDAPYAGTGTGAFDHVTVTTPAGTLWTAPRPTTAPTGLTVRTGADAVELAWTDPDPAARYDVLRATTSDGPFRTLATGVTAVGFGTRLRYADATGTPGARHHYAVARTNAAGRGPLSAPAPAQAPTPAVPRPTSPTAAFGNAGEPFRHLLRASHAPARFTADGLPAGLRVDRRTGLISGTPREHGTFTVTTRAGNAAGDTTGTLALTVGTPPPDPWTHHDLGDVILDERACGTLGVVAIRTPGSASYRDRTFTVRGAGVDLSVNGQGMTGQFVHRTVTGDHTLTARLVSRTAAGDATDRVGLLITKSLSPFDQAAGLVVTGGTTAQFMLRPTVAGPSVFSEFPATPGTATTVRLPLPLLLRLKRTGTAFAAAVSTDGGATWTAPATGEIPAFGDAPCHVGLVVCSRSPQALATSEFDEVSVQHD